MSKKIGEIFLSQTDLRIAAECDRLTPERVARQCLVIASIEPTPERVAALLDYFAANRDVLDEYRYEAARYLVAAAQVADN